MFTGIISHIGTITRIDEGRGDRRIFIDSELDLAGVEVGASVSCSGCCLTVVEKEGRAFAADVSAETLTKTTIGMWETGSRVNLERALRAGDELGGHLVSGNVDGLATIQDIKIEGDSHRLMVTVPGSYARYIAPKGSVSLDGVSLTVNEVEGPVFGVNIIPHTWIHTTLGDRKAGDHLNLEVDMLARYVERMLGASQSL